METELQQFSQERSERVRLLREKHERQLESFDIESASMGFRWDTPYLISLNLISTVYLTIFLAPSHLQKPREKHIRKIHLKDLYQARC